MAGPFHAFWNADSLICWRCWTPGSRTNPINVTLFSRRPAGQEVDLGWTWHHTMSCLSLKWSIWFVFYIPKSSDSCASGCFKIAESYGSFQPPATGECFCLLEGLASYRQTPTIHQRAHCQSIAECWLQSDPRFLHILWDCYGNAVIMIQRFLS